MQPARFGMASSQPRRFESAAPPQPCSEHEFVQVSVGGFSHSLSFDSPSAMASLKARNNAFVQDTHDQLRGLCRQPCNVDPKSGVRGVISDEKFESIAACLRDLEMDEASDRPRTYAVLHMMNRIDLITAFVVNGLLDNSFPYADRKSLPPLMRREHDACHDFLDLQYHVMSAACHMEKGLDSIHVHAESGDVFFQRIEKLGRGGEAYVRFFRFCATSTTSFISL